MTIQHPIARYVFSAVKPDGGRSYVEVQAATIAAARYRLRVQGYDGLELIQDELDDSVHRVSGTDEAFCGVDLQKRVEFERRCTEPRHGLFLLWQLIQNQWPTVLMLGISVWLRASGSHSWNVWSLIVYGVAVGYALLLVRAQFPALLYQRLLEARSWHRWDDAAHWTRRIRQMRALTGLGIPEYDLLFTEAKALAARGNLRGALEKVCHLEEDATFDSVLYWALLAGVYAVAGRFAEQVVCCERALALKSDCPSSRIDLAYALALYQRDASRAREVLAEMDEADVKPCARAHYYLCQGAIALEEGRPEQAEELFAQSITHARTLTGNPLAEGFVRLIRGYRGLALRRSGRREEAEQEWADVEAYLQATAPQPVVGLWQAADPR